MQFLDFANIHIFHNKYSSAEEVTLNDLRTLQTSDIYSFMFFLAENNYKTNSRITKTEHIRCFFDFLSRIKKTLFKEPIKPIKREKKSNQKLPNYLSLEESKKLISVYLNSENEAGIRNNAILNILLNCGLRVSEVSNLNISDFKAENEMKEEKLALLKYTYEQILSSQAEQVNGKSNNIDNISNIGKMFINDTNKPTERKLSVI